MVTMVLEGGRLLRTLRKEIADCGLAHEVKREV
jgi:hypothetical protein